MSGVAIGGAAIVGAGVSLYGADQASSAASDATKASSAASDAQLAFQQQQYEDWKGIYGDVQQNLSQYYKDLTPDTIEALGITNVEKEYAKGIQNLDQSLAQRGLSNSGAAVQGVIQLEQARSSDKAQVRATAPMVAAEQQASFLGLGLGLESSLQQGIASSYGSQATIQANAANTYNQQAAAGMANVGTSIGSGVNSYLTYSSLQQPSLLQPYNSSGGSTIAGGFSPL